jgi:hypothetical protein
MKADLTQAYFDGQKIHGFHRSDEYQCPTHNVINGAPPPGLRLLHCASFRPANIPAL